MTTIFTCDFGTASRVNGTIALRLKERAGVTLWAPMCVAMAAEIERLRAELAAIHHEYDCLVKVVNSAPGDDGSKVDLLKLGEPRK